MKKIIIPILSLLPFFSVQAQFEKNLYTCDEETYDLLKNLSDSQLGKGRIYLFTTTHQDLAWLNHIDACIADRDTLWLTPCLKRLEEDPTFKMDIEQKKVVFVLEVRTSSRMKKCIQENHWLVSFIGVLVG